MALRVLIVDDSPQFRAAAAELLADRGFVILPPAADGDEAVRSVTDNCPDGILLDINLSDTDGFTVASTLSAACPCTKIVLTSANVAELPEEVLQSSAAAAFVCKDALAATDLRVLFKPEEK